MRGKWKKPLIPRNFISPSNTVNTCWSCFLSLYIEDFSVWLIPWRHLMLCFWIWLEWHKNDRWKLAVVPLLAKGKGRKREKIKKKKRKEGGEHYKWVQKFGEVLGALCSFPRLAPFVSINIELGINPQDWCAHYAELFHFSLYWKIISTVFSGGWYCSLHLWHTGFG